MSKYNSFVISVFRLITVLVLAVHECISQICNPENLVNNGHFKDGYAGFTSEYDYCFNNLNSNKDCLVQEGRFVVGRNPLDYHYNFKGSDHTSGNGNFLIVNGASATVADESIVVWSQTITNIQSNTLYSFGCWVTSISETYDDPSAVAQLQFSISTPSSTATPIGNVFSSPILTNEWLEFNAEWYSGNHTSATISIVNLNKKPGGNDFGIDDIQFTEACSLPLSILEFVVSKQQNINGNEIIWKAMYIKDAIYVLERSEHINNEYETINVSEEPYGVFLDQNLHENKSYYYRLMVKNTNGNVVSKSSIKYVPRTLANQPLVRLSSCGIYIQTQGIHKVEMIDLQGKLLGTYNFSNSNEVTIPSNLTKNCPILIKIFSEKQIWAKIYLFE